MAHITTLEAVKKYMDYLRYVSHWRRRSHSILCGNAPGFSRLVSHLDGMFLEVRKHLLEQQDVKVKTFDFSRVRAQF